MFVFKFHDGNYYKESGSDYMDSKRHVEFFSRNGDAVARLVERQKQYKTTDINEAKLFKSKQAVRSSNCYGYGGTIHEVKVKIELV